jgi:hypothetical protein
MFGVHDSNEEIRVRRLGVFFMMLLYGVPLTALISLVYCATRYEIPARIIQSAVAMFIKTVAGLTLLYGVLWFFSR